jgi:hypothetical protein
VRWSPMNFLCLLLALTGAPLRQAEAAEVLECAFADLACSHQIEAAEGDVAHDDGFTIVKADTGSQAPAAELAPAPAWLALSIASPQHHAFVSSAGDPCEGPKSHLAGRRCAWFQRFLC